MADENSLAGIKIADLPAPPQTALEILQACADPDVSSKQLAEIASRDAGLTAELLRMANSPFFGVSRKVSTVTRAVMILGQRALRNLVLCISMRKALCADNISGVDVTTYWEHTLRRAVAARNLGQTQRIAPDECLTVGLLQDFGLLVLLHAHPGARQQWAALHRADPDRRYELEREIFGTTHDEVGAILSRAWSLPEELGIPLAWHHNAPPADTTPLVRTLCHVAQCADWMAAVYGTDASASVLGRCQGLLYDHFRIDHVSSREMLSGMAEGVGEAASALGLRVRKQLPIEEVMRRANRHLAEEALSYQELTWRLQQALEERDRLANELQRDLELAREIQRSLLPTTMDPALPIKALNISARAVSGDFYDYFRLRDGRILFNLADVSGKGMNAALLMAKTSSLFHCLGKSVPDPARLIALLNDELCESSVRGMFVTMVGGLLDLPTGRIELVNAGHPPALWVGRSGEIVELPAQAPPLGLFPGTSYPKAELTLDSGTFFVFSDGLSECVVEDAEPLGIEGVKRLLLRVKDVQPAERLQKLVELVTASGRAPRDDLTLLAIDR